MKVKYVKARYCPFVGTFGEDHFPATFTLLEHTCALTEPRGMRESLGESVGPKIGWLNFRYWGFFSIRIFSRLLPEVPGCLPTSWGFLVSYQTPFPYTPVLFGFFPFYLIQKFFRLATFCLNITFKRVLFANFIKIGEILERLLMDGDSYSRGPVDWSNTVKFLPTNWSI